MTESPAFEVVCETVEAFSDLSRAEARGTVRLALKDAGLDSSDVTSQQIRVVLEKLLPQELARSGVPDAEALCQAAARAAAAADAQPRRDSPADVFARLAGDE